MKKTIKLAFIVCLIILMSVLMFTACNFGVDMISFKSFQVNGTNVYGVVSNDTTMFSFIDEIAVSGKATYVVSLDIYGMKPVNTKTVPLASGDNTFYVCEQVGDTTKLYIVTIRRKPIYTVYFDPADGSPIASQTVEEGSCVVLPDTPKRLGYTFIDWTYDSSTPIIGDTLLEARWKISDEMSDFVFSSSGNDCTITGVHDNTKTDYTIPDYVTSINKGAFKDCSSLTSIIIPDSVTSIGDDAFYGCNSLKSITLPFVGATKDGAFHKYFGYIFGTLSNNNYIPTSLKTVVITGGTNIGSYAFEGCSNLTSITIPNTVTSIGDYAFHNCTNLTTVTIGNNVTSIGDNAFSSCSSLTSITIPDSVTHIGAYAFRDCSHLTSFTFKNPNGWWRVSNSTSRDSISESNMANPLRAARYLTSSYYYYWERH